MKQHHTGERRRAASIFAATLMMVTVSVQSQQTSAPAASTAAKTEAGKTEQAKPGSVVSPHAALPSKPAATPAPPKQIKKVDINNATLAELRALPLGEAEAQRVIAHRPYKARGELMTKAGLPEGVYFSIKDKLELQEPRKRAPKK